MKNKYLPRIITYAIVVALIPIVMHIVFSRKSAKVAEDLRNGEDVVIINLPRQGAANPEAMPIQVFGTYGDIFQPNINGLDRSYDLIILSATIDPISSIDSTIMLNSNMLVRSFFSHAYSTDDTALVLSGVKALLINMTKRNREYIAQLLKYENYQTTINDAYLTKLCEPHYEEIPIKSPLRYNGIKWFAVLPLFNAEQAGNMVDGKEKMKLNVKTAMYRVFTDIKNAERLRFIGIPAVSGSENLNDSRNYLKYYDSFGSIIQAFMGVKLPESLERIYLVAWNKWQYYLPSEDYAARKALGDIYDKYYIESKGAGLIAYAMLFIFAASYIFWLIIKYDQLRPKNTLLKPPSVEKFIENKLVSLFVFIGIESFTYFSFAGKIKIFLLWTYHSLGLYPLIAVEALMAIFCVALAKAVLQLDKIRRG